MIWFIILLVWIGLVALTGFNRITRARRGIITETNIEKVKDLPKGQYRFALIFMGLVYSVPLVAAFMMQVMK